MNKLRILLLIVLLCTCLLGCEKEKSIEEINENNTKLLTEYVEANYQVSGDTLKDNFVDIDYDNEVELVLVTNAFGSDNIHIYKCSGDEVIRLLPEVPASLGSVHFDVREGASGEEFYVDSYFADGLCYESYNYLRINVENGKYSWKPAFSYSCDQELEEKLRKEIEDKYDIEDMTIASNFKVIEDDSENAKEYISPEEYEEKEFKAHRLKYNVGNKVVTKEEYDNYIKAFEDEHKLIKTIEYKEKEK